MPGMRHAKVSAQPPSLNPALVQPTDWNADHVIDDGAIAKSKLAAGIINATNAKDHAIGNGVADDRAGFLAAIAEASAAQHKTLYIPRGNYKLSKYLEVSHAHGLRIVADGGARFIYPSDDVTVPTDGIATSAAHARSAIFLRYCSDITVENVTFIGGQNTDISNLQWGSGIYATHCVGVTVRNCRQIYGASIAQQDATLNTTGAGTTLTAAGGLVTVVSSTATFQQGHGVGVRFMTISNATNPANNGVHRIVSYTNATTVVIDNPAGVTESSAFRWEVDDGDRELHIEGGSSFGARAGLHPANHSTIDKHSFEHPDTGDETGQGDYISISGTTCTLTDLSWGLGYRLVGKRVVIAGSTSPANNGTFLVTACTPRSNVSPGTIVYENPAGVTESFAGTWWIANGEKTGVGVGASGLTKAGATMTMTASVNAFHSSDVGKNIRIMDPTSAGNKSTFTITGVPAANQVTFENSGGVAEAYSGRWTLDGFDRIGGSSTGIGSSHAIYIFAGRSNVKITRCTFRNIRTTAIKVSGSSLPITDISADDCFFYRCGRAISWGADDSQEHTNLTVTRNRFNDCATGRAGWNDTSAVAILGARSVTISNSNKFYWSQNNIRSVDGSGMGALFAISVGRYASAAGGRTQPCEGVTIDGNQFTCDPNQTTPGSMVSSAIDCSRVGQRAYFNTGGTLTKSGNTMTLTDSAMSFNSQLVGHTIDLINSASGNDGSFIVKSVPSNTTLTFDNAGGTGGGVSAGTFRIFPDRSLGTHTNSYHRGGILTISNNTFDNVAHVIVSTLQCVAPKIVDNTWAFGSITLQGDVMPLVRGNRTLAINTAFAQIQMLNVAWPIIHDNHAINQTHMSNNSEARDMRIGIGTTVVDHPLLGNRGRARPTDGREEVVVAYGDGHVDGDTLDVRGTVYTYKTTAPAGNQFNSLAGLIALIDAQAFCDCADYGTGFAAGSIATGHMRIRLTSREAADTGTLYVISRTLNPTALVILRNAHSGGTPSCHGRGTAAGPSGPPNKTVVWSPLAGHTCATTLLSDNDAATQILAGSPAAGLITCVTKANLVDGEYLTIGDGINPPKLYEFDGVSGAADGVTAGRIAVDVFADTTAAQVAARLRTAILANQPALSVTDNANGTLTISHLIPGAVGNVAMTENVANAGFLVTGLANGGVGGYRQLRNANDSGCCALIQHAKSSSQAGVDLGAEFRWSLAS